MDFKNLLIENCDGVATLTINRPEALNALNSEVLTELGCALKTQGIVEIDNAIDCCYNVQHVQNQ